MARFVLLVLSAVLLAACGEGTSTPSPRPGADQLSVEVLAFDPGGAATDDFAAISEEPIRWRAFAGWYGGSAADTSMEDIEPQAAKPDTTYVAVTAMTGCRAPEDVTAQLLGDDLIVEFTGGTEQETCYRAFGPTALLAIPTDKVSDVRTVNGTAPLAPGGPGEPRDFVPLGTVPMDPPMDAVPPVELPDTSAMLGRVAATEHAADARAALGRPLTDGKRGFAFVLAGCAETGAVLLVDHGLLSAELTGGETTRCDAPAYFLATFELDPKDVPDAKLTQ